MSNSLKYLTVLVLVASSLCAKACENVEKRTIEQPYPIISMTTFNQNYFNSMINKGSPEQETPWGFQEINITNAIEHDVNSIIEYNNYLKDNKRDALIDGELQWKDNKVHIIHFLEGDYKIPNNKKYSICLVPSKTIVEGDGIDKTIFIANVDINHTSALFNLEFAKHDVVVRKISFHNETKDNHWKLFHANGSIDRENYLFENIEFDDTFGAIGKENYNSNFITFRGLKKRIGNTTERINKYYTTPIPASYQFRNKDNVLLAGQIGIRNGNSVVFHDCELGDNLSATLDIYSNYVEIVGVNFINPLYDHSIKSPRGNHLYIHDSTFELNYDKKLIQGTGYWNPTFLTHELTSSSTISLRKNYHFKNLKFKRDSQVIKVENAYGLEIAYVESEPFSIYDNQEKRKKNVSGDTVWENISFEGYSSEHEIVGYPNVQTNEGYEALNYTDFTSKSAQIKEKNNDSHGDYEVDVQEKEGSSKEDITGVYSWGNKTDGTIDYPRDNRLFVGKKSEANKKPYVKMVSSSSKDSYNKKLEE